MNDPFDSRGVCWNTDEIEDFLKTKVPKNKIKEFGSIDSIVDGAIASLRNNIKIKSCVKNHGENRVENLIDAMIFC